MNNSINYLPIYETRRGSTTESVHFGAVAVVDVYGNLLASYGNPEAITYMRSSAKPIQVLPFLENGGEPKYGLTDRQIAILCASHSGTDEHVRVIEQIQKQTGVVEDDLLCGTHPLEDEVTVELMRQRGEALRPNRHNCSGKHTGMAAFATMSGYSLAKYPYIAFDHPIQQMILAAFSDMTGCAPPEIGLGIDGCSAPNFAVPLKNAALAFARLCDPAAGGITSPARADACRKAVTAMMANPEMVAGAGRFDTCLMEVASGRIVSKGGAEGYQALGLKPGTLGPGSPAVGITLKISDGDGRHRAVAAVALDVLKQLKVLSAGELQKLSQFGPDRPFENWRGLLVGSGEAVLKLNYAG